MQDDELTPKHPSLPPEEVEKLDEDEWEEVDKELDEVLEEKDGEGGNEVEQGIDELDHSAVTVGDREDPEYDNSDGELDESTAIGD